MVNVELVKKLKILYEDNSKHSGYQNIPEFIRHNIGFSESIDENWRGDTARYNHLLKLIDFNNISSVGDIGANTGFFSLSLIEKFKHLNVYAYEANPNHSNLINIIKDVFNLSFLEVNNTILTIDNINSMKQQDLLLFYNVLHHAGVDFDRSGVDLNTFYDYSLRYIKQLSLKSKYILFQMGSNWGGNKKTPIIPLENDLEKILYNCDLFCSSGWDILDISLVKKNKNGIEYFNVEDDILKAILNYTKGSSKFISKYVQSLKLNNFSEFYRRPIFYCKSNNFFS